MHVNISLYEFWSAGELKKKEKLKIDCVQYDDNPPIWGATTTEQISTDFGKFLHFADVINRYKFGLVRHFRR